MGIEWFYAGLPFFAMVLDGLVGDPRWRFHPVALVGQSLDFTEKQLRRLGWDEVGGGVLLFLILAGFWVGLYFLLEKGMESFGRWPSTILQVTIASLLLSLRSLVEHGWTVVKGCRVSVSEGRAAAALLVGRDTDKMEPDDCRRAAVESLAEGLVDGIISPLFYLALFGIPGMLLFKVVSTMDSMVGYKTEPYLRFGWCGARLDDLMNYVPARLTFLLIALVAFVHPKLNGRSAWRIGLAQHGILPGPNSGWGEAPMAGALGLQIAGPIYKDGRLVNEQWIGEEGASRECTDGKVRQAVGLTLSASVFASVLFALVGVLVRVMHN